MTADGNKLIHKQKIGDEESTTIREFSGDKLKATFTAKGVTAVREYKKVCILFEDIINIANFKIFN